MHIGSYGLPEFIVLLLIALGIALYFLPAYIAHKRKHPSFGGILLLNILLGWTLIGWLGALIWASASTGTATTVQIINTPPAPSTPAPPPATGTINFCSKCGSKIKPQSAFCENCGAKIN